MSEQKVKNLRSLIEISGLLNLISTLDELLSTALEVEKKVMRAEAGSIMLLDKEKEHLIFQVALGEAGDRVKEIKVQKGQGIAGWVAGSGKSLLVPDVTKDDRFDPSFDKRSGFTTKSILCVPLKVKDEILGVAQVINRMDGNPFNSDDVELMDAFANILAVAIENARLQQDRLTKQRIEQELSFAEKIQQSFLPDSPPVSEYYTIAACNYPALSVGGDLYDFRVWNDQEVGIVLGDVSGKGIPAALYMARFVSDFQFLAGERGRTEPFLVFENLNDLLSARSQRGMFVTVVYLYYNARKHNISITSAGHQPPLFFSAATKEVTRLRTKKGIPMGMIPKMQYDTLTVPIEKGDMILLYTDGINEARNVDNEEFEISKLEQVFAGDTSSSSNCVEHIIKTVKDFSAGAPQHDDMTLVALQVLK